MTAYFSCNISEYLSAYTGSFDYINVDNIFASNITGCTAGIDYLFNAYSTSTYSYISNLTATTSYLTNVSGSTGAFNYMDTHTFTSDYIDVITGGIEYLTVDYFTGTSAVTKYIYSDTGSYDYIYVNNITISGTVTLSDSGGFADDSSISVKELYVYDTITGSSGSFTELYVSSNSEFEGSITISDGITINNGDFDIAVGDTGAGIDTNFTVNAPATFGNTVTISETITQTATQKANGDIADPVVFTVNASQTIFNQSVFSNDTLSGTTACFEDVYIKSIIFDELIGLTDSTAVFDYIQCNDGIEFNGSLSGPTASFNYLYSTNITGSTGYFNTIITDNAVVNKALTATTTYVNHANINIINGYSANFNYISSTTGNIQYLSGSVSYFDVFSGSTGVFEYISANNTDFTSMTTDSFFCDNIKATDIYANTFDASYAYIENAFFDKIECSDASFNTGNIAFLSSIRSTIDRELFVNYQVEIGEPFDTNGELLVYGSSSITESCTIGENLNVMGNVSIYGSFSYNSLSLTGDLSVMGTCSFRDDVTVTVGNLMISNGTITAKSGQIDNSFSVDGGLRCSSQSSVQYALSVNGISVFNDNSRINGDLVITGNLFVDGGSGETFDLVNCSTLNCTDIANISVMDASNVYINELYVDDQIFFSRDMTIGIAELLTPADNSLEYSLFLSSNVDYNTSAQSLQYIDANTPASTLILSTTGEVMFLNSSGGDTGEDINNTTITSLYIGTNGYISNFGNSDNLPSCELDISGNFHVSTNADIDGILTIGELDIDGGVLLVTGTYNGVEASVYSVNYNGENFQNSGPIYISTLGSGNSITFNTGNDDNPDTAMTINNNGGVYLPYNLDVSGNVYVTNSVDIDGTLTIQQLDIDGGVLHVTGTYNGAEATVYSTNFQGNYIDCSDASFNNLTIFENINLPDNVTYNNIFATDASFSDLTITESVTFPDTVSLTTLNGTDASFNNLSVLNTSYAGAFQGQAFQYEGLINISTLGTSNDINFISGSDVNTPQLTITSDGYVNINGATNSLGTLSIKDINLFGRVPNTADGSNPDPGIGTLSLEHNNDYGASSIVFQSTANRSSDFGAIMFFDTTAVNYNVVGTTSDELLFNLATSLNYTGDIMTTVDLNTDSSTWNFSEQSCLFIGNFNDISEDVESNGDTIVIRSSNHVIIDTGYYNITQEFGLNNAIPSSDTSYAGGNVIILPYDGTCGVGTTISDLASNPSGYKFWVNGDSYISGDLVLGGSLSVSSGSLTLDGVTINGTATIDNLTVTGSINGSGTTGSLTLTNITTVNTCSAGVFQGPAFQYNGNITISTLGSGNEINFISGTDANVPLLTITGDNYVHINSPTFGVGTLSIRDINPYGTVPTPSYSYSYGTISLEHENLYGACSIVFHSTTNNNGGDYAGIMYFDTTAVNYTTVGSTPDELLFNTATSLNYTGDILTNVNLNTDPSTWGSSEQSCLFIGGFNDPKNSNGDNIVIRSTNHLILDTGCYNGTQSVGQNNAIPHGDTHLSGGYVIIMPHGGTCGIGYSISKLEDFDSSDNFRLVVNGNLYLAGAMWNESDYRIKLNVKDLDINEFSIDTLRPVSYTRIGTNEFQTGFIAHELQESGFGYMVKGEQNEEVLQTVNYIGFISVLVKELQELKARVKELESKI